MADRWGNAYEESLSSDDHAPDVPDNNHDELDQKVFLITAVISAVIAVGLSSIFKSIPWVSLLTGVMTILLAMALRAVFKRISAAWTGVTPSLPTWREIEELRKKCDALEQDVKETKRRLRSAETEEATSNMEGKKREEALRIKIERMSKTIKDLEAEVEATRKELERRGMQGQGRAVEDHSAGRIILESKVKSLEKEIETLRKELADKKVEVERLLKTKEELEKAVREEVEERIQLVERMREEHKKRITRLRQVFLDILHVEDQKKRLVDEMAQDALNEVLE